VEVIPGISDRFCDEFVHFFGVEGDLVDAGGFGGHQEVGCEELFEDELVVGWDKGLVGADEKGLVAVDLGEEEVGAETAEDFW
jgi:hypothetical protein